MYNYQNVRDQLFKEEGSNMFMAIRDHAKALIKLAGAAKLEEMIKGASGGDAWLMCACVDRMVEIGEIREIPQDKCAGQDRVFVSAK